MKSLTFPIAALFAVSTSAAWATSTHEVEFFGTGGLNSGRIAQNTDINRSDSAVLPLTSVVGEVGSASAAYMHSSGNDRLEIGATANVETLSNNRQTRTASARIDNGQIRDTITFSASGTPFDVFFGLNHSTKTLLSSTDNPSTFASIYFSLSISRVGGVAGANGTGNLQVIDGSPNDSADTSPSGPVRITVTPGSSLSVVVFYDISVGAGTVPSGADEDFAEAEGSFDWFMDTPDGTVFTSALGLSYEEAAPVPLPATGLLLLGALAGLGAKAKARRKGAARAV